MTFSLIALKPDTRTLGIACATGGPALGGFVPHLLPGVGAVVTQGYSTNVAAAERALAWLAEGWHVEDVIAQLRGEDRGQAWRQLALMDIQGQSAGWSGTANETEVAMHLGPGLAVAGNMLANDTVMPAMVAAFHAAVHRSASLADALLAALVDGQIAGGDRRGEFSAALKVRSSGGIPLDLRIDDATDAVAELVALHGRIHADTEFQSFLARLPTADDPHRH
ncbi:DUF1028 domain-containing protein [Aidingimonas halophila]|uniref:Uncharacterized conserved protein, Ntn-hydrolase superfamily n=1 Tax=Aidingimonas halophila TaxID=574349 RepID=A0A1H2RT19_9GAMM|nr:DUF1028 domain-containing protein [Aidingimonas halophila]GHC18849.1 pilus assembly protein [Aidingimonas halophila]SDW21779.1 Uncharacterized conserved protein, Ntn-hydrolase superfamily [Aidingimonas halophila]